ncbi:hypothetical protein DSO57_1011999 [Entomophthora muscae]|uniref:Uncharacterized protein n=1 Tax=Entomophthora muscae TaxID=34485 RepID=A0ACC2UFV7_9FUNG|nr:hypothetical protein DSO57_1011999 [Entomophthora muscae]
MKLMFSLILVYVTASEVALSGDPQELELYNDYCFEQQSNIDVLFRPLETFPRILERAGEMLGGAEDELFAYSNLVFATIWDRTTFRMSSLVDMLFYYDRIHRYGVDSIRKLYFDQLRSIELVKQTAHSRAYDVLLEHSGDFDFYNHTDHHQETLAEIDSLARVSIQKITNCYIKLMYELDVICQYEGDYFVKLSNLHPK